MRLFSILKGHFSIVTSISNLEGSADGWGQIEEIKYNRILNTKYMQLIEILKKD